VSTEAPRAPSSAGPGAPSDQPADRLERGLILRGVSKSYAGVHALRGVDLVAHTGEVHGLIGENGAGKSTLVKILSGAVRADSGELLLGGEPCVLGTPALARDVGIATAYQELSLVPDWDVATNLLYGNEPVVRAGRISARAARRSARSILRSMGVETIDPTAVVRELRLAERQVLEIVRALLADPRLLILDEPTSALAPDQVSWFFSKVKEFVSRDRLVLFISHRLEEIAALCDRVTVFRDGRHVGAGPIDEMPEARLVSLMLGQEREHVLVHSRRQKATSVQRKVAARVEGLDLPPRLHEVSFEVGTGEILGVAGLEGQGQLDLFLALYGVRRYRGSVLLGDRPIRPRSPAEALRHGIGLVPEDRGQALCMPRSIADNLTLGSLADISRFGLISRSRESAIVSHALVGLKVRAWGPEQTVETLSGGNQQKVLLGRVLEAKPRLLLMYDATRGVDVGTKAEIFDLMHELAATGVAIVYYSTDLTELLSTCDRVIVMHDGRIRATLADEELTHAGILSAVLGGGGGRG
jgi:ribose transport system ATP-binding protein